ncbi:hypothetical protein [Streptomyces palmae]|uniref:Uncharacterized protein n=1 Tax=Streptomyces palmae TaxID=1701085 RepID=A0A4Z0GTN2_9ACTN|nr:hypothetical protein [Streptomyces palmae]TGB00061.1 hypothetical protein E4099_22080 [Streptomyces palmae]
MTRRRIRLMAVCLVVLITLTGFSTGKGGKGGGSRGGSSHGGGGGGGCSGPHRSSSGSSHHYDDDDGGYSTGGSGGGSYDSGEDSYDSGGGSYDSSPSASPTPETPRAEVTLVKCAHRDRAGRWVVTVRVTNSEDQVAPWSADVVLSNARGRMVARVRDSGVTEAGETKTVDVPVRKRLTAKAVKRCKII